MATPLRPLKFSKIIEYREKDFPRWGDLVEAKSYQTFDIKFSNKYTGRQEGCLTDTKVGGIFFSQAAWNDLIEKVNKLSICIKNIVEWENINKIKKEQMVW